jgi:2,3-bisphosphoglycerate-dependent phosphoglycerate mutase
MQLKRNCGNFRQTEILSLKGVVILATLLIGGIVCGEEPTTFFVVRHADRVENQDDLTEAGVARAQQLKSILVPLRIKAIYSTDFVRTKSTARPLAETLSLSPVLYDKVSDDFLAKLKAAHPGQAVLIIGHSNTVGKIVKGLGAELEPTIGEREFDRLFVVSIQDGKASVIALRFGE